MRLNGRLKAVGEYVPKCGMVFDIGSDHACIPVYLVRNGICEKAVATEIKEGPLRASIGNIKRYGLEKNIETRLGDGLDVISEDEPGVIVIAGMGGLLICNILRRGIQKAVNAPALVLQPMNAVKELREWLLGNGFDIEDEKLVNEGEKIYNVIRAKWTGNRERYEKIYFYIGKRLIEKKDPLLIKYLDVKKRQLLKALSQMRKSSKADKGLEAEYSWLCREYGRIMEEVGKDEEDL